MKKVKVSIIVVYFKGRRKLFKCLASIKRSRAKTPYEVIVVDNSMSKDIEKDLGKKFPEVCYVKSLKNLGYGGGNNLGVEKAKGEFLFILNPDTEVFPGTIDKLAEFLKRGDVAMVAPNLVDKKGRIFSQLGSRTLTPLAGIVALSFINKLFPNNPVSREYWLKDVPMDKLREVDAVPGSAFMIKRSVFEEVGRFDEKMFLFFEESDLGKRVKEAGYKIFINPKAQVMHHWSGKGKKPENEKLLKYFRQSRFYYFKKHYGLFPALVVEVFTRFSKWHALLLGVIILGVFLRFFRIEENLVFHGELGHNYLAIKNFIEKGELPLLGPPTSHPWLNFGPLYYYLFAPFLWLAGFNPVAGAYFFAVIGILTIILNYFVVKETFGERVAIISSFLISVSPAWVSLTRGSRFFSLVTLLFYPLFFFLVRTIRENGKYLFWIALFFGIMLNFHLSPLVFLPAIVVALYLKRKQIGKRHVLAGFLGFLIPNIPFLLYNAETGFKMLLKFSLWIPYRIFGFFGLYPKNTANPFILKSNLVSFYKFFGLNYMANEGFFSSVIFFLVLGFVVWETIRNLLARKKDTNFLTLVLLLVSGYLGIFVHGAPPSHYYLPLWPIPVLFLSILLVKMWERVNLEIVLIFLIVVGFINFKYFFSSNYFYRPQGKIVDSLVPYDLQLRAARAIITDANWSNFSFSRVGPFDYFEGNYAQNYQYLLWWLGNEPVKEARVKYTLYEGKDRFPKSAGNIVFEEDGLLVTKEILENEKK